MVVETYVLPTLTERSWPSVRANPCVRLCTRRIVIADGVQFRGSVSFTLIEMRRDLQASHRLPVPDNRSLF